MTDLEYIKKFSKITIKSICKKNHINSSNVWAGRASAENLEKIRKDLESEIAKLYVIKDNE